MTRLLTKTILGLTLVSLSACQPWRVQPEVQPPSDIPAAPSQPTDALVIPGERVGPITAQTSRADLAARYGEAALRDGPIALGEGTTEPGTVVNEGSDQQLAVVWQDAAQIHPRLIKDFGPAWQTPEGLGVGVPYAALQAALGDFELYGFAWDYGGTLVLEDTQLDHYDGALLLRLAPSERALTQHPEAYQAVMGDGLFASKNPNLAVLDLSINEMVVFMDAAP
ncbi:hypothetical protein PGN35_004740 [Nodosilinea sp. PGN35]|uniref:hypothetical protein n=1 Tax=Nodosilinea sp. PGN35 TaxID=3020489 RepID=UPI0023B34B53|nr:hypothetical protein [Nodosilinea sp. TSF1-S3]MDF0367543.1 hypothetical protein [Nodosilinea sp. TSF1-S3]